MILVTGGTGLVGHAIGELGNEEIKLVGKADCDLRDLHAVNELFLRIKPTKVIHLAAKVGGIMANMKSPAHFFRDNILINTNVLHASWMWGVESLVSLMSTCIYPDQVNYPITEDQLHNGPPHSSNYAYAYAKRMLDVQGRAYRHEYGCNFTTVVPNNLYGPFDNFNKEYGHFIPSVIHKIYEAKLNGETRVTLWGTGNAFRQFTYSRDIARVILWCLNNYDKPEPLNIGVEEEFKIKHVAELIADEIGFEGELVWDENKPTGQIRKKASCSKLAGCDHWTSIEEGIRHTVRWFEKEYPNVRLG